MMRGCHQAKTSNYFLLWTDLDSMEYLLFKQVKQKTNKTTGIQQQDFFLDDELHYDSTKPSFSASDCNKTHPHESMKSSLVNEKSFSLGFL